MRDDVAPQPPVFYRPVERRTHRRHRARHRADGKSLVLGADVAEGVEIILDQRRDVSLAEQAFQSVDLDALGLRRGETLRIRPVPIEEFIDGTQGGLVEGIAGIAGDAALDQVAHFGEGEFEVVGFE